MTKVLLIPGKIFKGLIAPIVKGIFYAIAAVFIFFYEFLKKILEIIEDIAYNIEDEAPAYIVSGILAVGIAFGTWTLSERVFELEMLYSVLATVAALVVSFFIIAFLAFNRDYGSRPVKLFIMLGLAVAGVAGFFTVPPPAIVIEPLTATVSAEALNMRNKPSDAGAVLKTIKKGETLILIGNSLNGWTPVRYGDAIGHVNSSSISVTKQNATVKSKNLILYAGPFTNSSNLKILNKGDVLDATGPSANGWTPVKFGATAGYVNSYLIIIKNLPTVMTVTANSLVLYTGPSTTSTTLKFLKKGDALIVSGSASNGWTPVLSGTTAGWVPSNSIAIKADPSETLAKTPASATVATATVVAKSTFLYADRSPKSANLKTLKKGDAVIVTGADASGWTPVKSGNVTGWVLSSSIAVKKQ
jgi:uncharacterized protein YgiM (DUF1202 family)